MSPVPLLDLKIQYQSIQKEIDHALLSVVQTQSFILGKEVEAFEDELATYLGVRHVIGVSSGTDALLMSLMALGIGPSDEVLTTAFSFFATAGAIARLGARPVFVDIDPYSLNIAPEKVAEKISPQTRAIIPVHLFGRCAPIEALEAVAPNVPIIEDAAQAIGAKRLGRPAGSLGTMGCFSFFPSKNLGGYGDGGCLTTHESNYGQLLRALRVHGQTDKGRYIHQFLGGNFRLDALQAAILRVKLRHLNRWTEARRQNALRYRQLFQQGDLEVVLPPVDDKDSYDVYNQFVIRVSDRDKLQSYLKQRGIGCAVYYPRGLHLQPCFASLGNVEGDFPETEAASREILALPIYAELTESQQCEVVENILSFYRNRPRHR